MVFDFHFLLLLVFGWCTRYLIFPLLMIPVSRLRVRTKDKEKSKLLYTVEEIGPITVALSYVDLNGKEKLIYIKREDLEKKYELD